MKIGSRKLAWFATSRNPPLSGTFVAPFTCRSKKTLPTNRARPRQKL
jgi:hypothetical protein